MLRLTMATCDKPCFVNPEDVSGVWPTSGLAPIGSAEVSLSNGQSLWTTESPDEVARLVAESRRSASGRGPDITFARSIILRLASLCDGTEHGLDEDVFIKAMDGVFGVTFGSRADVAGALRVVYARLGGAS